MTDNYEGHTLSTFELTIKSSQEIYMENKYQYKGCQPNAVRLVCHFKFQRNGVEMSTNYSMLIWRQLTHQIYDMDETPNT